MAKEPNEIDDILLEVKKRRVENEIRLKGAEPHKENAPIKTEPNVKKSENLNNDTSNHIEIESKKEVEIEQIQKAPTETEFTADESVFDKKKIEEVPQFTEIVEDKPQEEVDVTADVPPLELNNEVKEEQIGEKDPDALVDLFALATNDDDNAQEIVPVSKNKGVKWRKTKKGKVIISIIVILVILIIGAGVFAVFYLNGALNKVTNDTEDYQKVDTYQGMDFLQEDFPTIEEMSASEVDDYKSYLKAWYESGDPVSSTHVLNILLIGEDTRDEEISDASRADSAIIASINVDTKQITLTSILRDLYVYFEVDGQGQYGKINAAASLGGMNEYITTVEKYYKVQIDNYAVVNFASFPKVIDSLGGVSISITDTEINEINNHQKRYGNVTIKKTFSGTEGTMKLTGKQALAYCRIRKIDSDGARADRQKTVLLKLFEQMKKASTLDAAKVVNQLVGYVYTGYSKKELVSVGKYALSEGWLSYETQTTTVPTSENAKGGEFKTSSGGYRYGGWIWKSDIPQDAYDLQMKIYGKSNITLAENRADYVNVW